MDYILLYADNNFTLSILNCALTEDKVPRPFPDSAANLWEHRQTHISDLGLNICLRPSTMKVVMKRLYMSQATGKKRNIINFLSSISCGIAVKKIFVDVASFNIL